MSKRLDENLGSVGYDGLIVANEPVADVLTVTIRKEATAAATYKRGTVLALPAGTAGDGKLVILGSTATTNETLHRQLHPRRGRGSRHHRGRDCAGLPHRPLRPQQAGRRQAATP